jgi:single-strand DNA-binding protein
MNTTTLTGNLTKDPEIRYTAEGKGFANFSIAVNRRYQTNGEWQEQTSFFDVICWRDLAENAVLSLGKGDRVTVTGYLEQRTWTTTEGQNRSRIELVADDIGVSLKFRSIPNSQPEYTSAKF